MHVGERLGAVAIVLACAGSVVAGDRALLVDDAVKIALARNPDVLAAELDVDAARRQRTVAGRWLRDNPQLTASAGPRDERGENGNSTDWGLALEQRVEIAGQRGLRIEEADATLRSTEASLAARQLELATLVRERFADAIAAHELAAVSMDERALASDAVRVARERNEAGDAPRIDVQTAEIELGRATRDAAFAAEDARRAELELKLLLGLEASEAISLRDAQGIVATACDPPAGHPASVSGRAELIAAREALAAARAAQRLAEREAFPAPSFGVSFEREAEDEIVQGTLSVPLPLFDRNQAARSAAQMEVGKARLALEAAERAVQRDVELAASRCRAARVGVESYGIQVVGAARRNLDLANEGYRAGKLGLVELQVIRREMLRARRGAIESRREWSTAVARMMRATGAMP